MAIWKDIDGNLHDDMDGAALDLPSWPTNLTLASDEDIEAARLPPAIPLIEQAISELNVVTGASGTIIRCVAAGVAIPAEWSAYVFALRAIANGSDNTSTALPVRPAYPAGT